MVVASRNRWIGAAALALAVPTGWALVRVAKPLLSADRDPAGFHGVRLGMSLSDVRAHLDIPGSFQASPEGDLFVLSFVPRAPAELVRARFEFHQGILVAIRAEVRSTDSEANGEALTVSPAAVVARRRAANGTVLVTVIARSCPAHTAEVQRLLGYR